MHAYCMLSTSLHHRSSLIDVDVHPTYVSIIIKSKLLRLHLPAEVQAGATKCQRSKTTGSLVLTMPKLNSRETTIFSKVDEQKKLHDKTASKTRGTATKKNTTIRKPKKLSMQEQMLADAAAAKAKAEGNSCNNSSNKLDLETSDHRSSSGMSVDIRNIVPKSLHRESDISLDSLGIHSAENVLPNTEGGNENKSLIHEID